MLSDDRDQVERVLAGEADAFEALVFKYNRLGGAIAFGILGDFGLAEDVVQESFLKVYRSLDSLRDPARFRPWFCGIVKKQAIDVFRQLKGRRIASLSVEDAPGQTGATDETPERTFLREEQREKIQDAMKELPSDDRLVLVLKHMEGLSYKEISDVTHTSVSAVESRLFRARRALRKKLADVIKLDF